MSCEPLVRTWAVGFHFADRHRPLRPVDWTSHSPKLTAAVRIHALTNALQRHDYSLGLGTTVYSPNYTI